MARTGAVIVAALLVVGPVVLAVGTAPAHAADDDSATSEEYFEAFRAMEGTEAFETYGEFETIRSFALSKTQVGELNDDDRAELDATLETLQTFEEAYEQADDDYEASLAAAEDVESAIDELETRDESQATLANLALVRFYEEMGDELRERADEAERTPERIELLSMTAEAYERAERPEEAAEFDVQAEQLEAEFERDTERMSDAADASGAVLDDCPDCDTATAAITGNGIGTFDRFVEVQSTYEDVRQAESLAATHGLEDREAELAAAGDELRDQRTAAALGSIAVLVGYGTVVGVIGTVASARVFAWKRTYEASQVGSIVPMGDSDE